MSHAAARAPRQATLQLEIVSAEAALFSGPVHRVTLKGVDGELGILPGHSPLLTPVLPGVARFLPEGRQEEDFLYVSGGMVEVQPDRTIVLADTALRSEEIDEAAARAAERRAREIMEESVLFSDRDAAHAELLRALAQLKVVEHARRVARRRQDAAPGGTGG
ncbi:ATP synthase F1 subcomplex epsilon subunit [Ectothiorhodospira mobilis]|uniref:ATP synthase epsilon chain n=1 Tax=Ectothiorhodospira mobilis TaxID=195064 RepID=A0A1I4QZ69_ECTMO|nr:F0F1 ATP synthase subunit epsilon [Ectothiorhodospira mobilis]SFM45308.1 ATP synthase F1 subcomplex epsilon subunit [Ectothiorhodospira mobilis]